MKLSPILLFLLLLIVLIISVIFIKPSKESFVSFYGSTEANTPKLTIPHYSNPVNKLYDNDFFDPKNGNILRVYACAYDQKTGQDTTGAGIDYIDLIDRSANSTKFEKNQAITTSNLTSIPNSYHTWTAYSTDEDFSHITSNQIVYSAWGQDTYIHVLDLNNNLNACGFLYSPNLDSPIYTDLNTSITKLNIGSQSKHRKHNKHGKHTFNKNTTEEGEFIYNNDFDKPLYKFDEHVFYSSLTGDLLLIDKNGADMIYNRKGNKVNSLSSNGGIESSTKPWVQYDLVGNHMIIYAPNKTNTTIILLKLNSDKLTYSIVSVGRFLADGSLQKDATTNIVIPSDLLEHVKTTKERVSAPAASPISTHTISPITDANFSMAQMNDYLLKTQIIPPICPSCPQCPGLTCTNCGSTPSAAKSTTPFSAASTTSSTPSAYRDDKHEFTNLLRDTGKGTKNLLEETGSGTVGLAKEAVGGTVGLAKEAVGGTVGLAKEAVGGAVGLLKGAGSGAVGLLKGAGSGALDLVKDTGSGAVNILEGGSQAGGIYGSQGSSYTGTSGSASTGYYAQGVQGPQNPWTYNGTLTEKPSSNFIPVTADFSSFRK